MFLSTIKGLITKLNNSDLSVQQPLSKVMISIESVEKGPPTKFPDPSLIIEKEYAASKHI